MDERDDINKMFADLQGQFDIEQPNTGHRAKFLEKLQANDTQVVDLRPKNRNWRGFLSIAASVLVLIGVGGFYFFNQETTVTQEDLEFAQSEQYFSNVIATQLEELNKEKTPETQKIIEDTFTQLQVLETDYNSLTIQLNEGADAKFIISAMIENFQTRLQLLEDVMEQINDVKAQKKENYEDNII